MNIVENAEKIARKAHEGQLRKWSANVPYIVHPIGVAEKVKSLSNVDDIDIAAALLHDVLEDCGEHWASVIEEETGREVLDLVRELTFETEGVEWVNRSRADKNVVRFRHMERMSARAKKIKMVDRWYNLNDMKNAPYKLIKKTVDESWKLLEICGDADKEMAKDLEDAIKSMERRLN
jgi:(p)ppGpp synthase/HD superfamily hydrolase